MFGAVVQGISRQNVQKYRRKSSRYRPYCGQAAILSRLM